MVSDGAGGAIVVWNDFRDDPDGDIYAQRQAVGAALDVATTLHADFRARWSGVRTRRSGASRVSFTLPTTEPATLEVLDVAGRRVESSDRSAGARHSHTMRVDGSRPFAPGMYLVRLSLWPAGRGCQGLRREVKVLLSCPGTSSSPNGLSSSVDVVLLRSVLDLEHDDHLGMELRSPRAWKYAAVSNVNR